MLNSRVVSKARHVAVSSGLVSLAVFPLAHGQEWSHSIEPYAMATTIEGDAGIGRIDGVPVDADMDAILETLEGAGMLHYEGIHESGWGVALDYGFMDLGADISSSRGGIIDAGVRQAVLEALLINRRTTDNGYLDFTVGVRWWDNDVDITVDPAILPGTVEADIEEDWIDLVIGARSYQQINDDWAFVVRGDVGGLGLEADFTASLAAGFQYRMSENWVLDLQYKGTWVDFEEGSKGDSDFFAYDTVTYGPLIGFIFEF